MLRESNMVENINPPKVAWKITETEYAEEFEEPSNTNHDPSAVSNYMESVTGPVNVVVLGTNFGSL